MRPFPAPATLAGALAAYNARGAAYDAALRAHPVDRRLVLAFAFSYPGAVSVVRVVQSNSHEERKELVDAEVRTDCGLVPWCTPTYECGAKLQERAAAEVVR